MRIIISPAKNMNFDTDSLSPDKLPCFLEDTAVLLTRLKQMNYQELKALWSCNDAIALENFERIQQMNLRSGLTPAIFSYQGIQYQYMAPDVFDNDQFTFIHKHLRILSGFYGVLRPFDGVRQYRLEMQARLSVGHFKNLYAFWGDKLTQQLTGECDFILNLASKEYSKAISAHLPKHFFFLNCCFGELINHKVIEKGTLCKMARGEMIRFLAENQITRPQDIKAFNDLGYTFSRTYSQADRYVFLKNKSQQTDF
ncbi:MAG: peroxide stress protein YaaA [Acetobacterium woodii]|nr:peroxide stress protein YaaA [Acetobacterium woodii]